jgi:hypothetical protein
MSLTKPILLAVVGILSVVLFLQVGNILTGMATSETIKSNATVGNQAPVVDSVALTQPTQTACSATTLTCKANVHDVNGNTDIDPTSYKAVIYHGSTSNACSANANDCYVYTTQCTDDAAAGDYRNVTCTAPTTFQYYADNGSWTCNFSAKDTSGSYASLESSSKSVSAYTALDVLSSVIEFGTLTVDTQSSVQNANVQNCGNYQMDISLSGTDMTGGSGTQATIGVGNLTYNTASNNATATALTSSAARIDNFNLAKKVTTDTTELTYWWLAAPHGTRGTYTGNITFDANLD